MSGEATIIPGIIGAAVIGAALIPILVGGAMIAGTVLAVKGLATAGKGAVGAAKIAHAESVRRRINSTYSKAAGLLAETADIQNDISAAMAQASNSVCEEYTKAVGGLNEAFSTKPDTSAFVECYEKSRRAFSADFDESLSAVERKFALPMEAALNKTVSQLEKERAEVLSSIEAIKGDIAARDEKAGLSREKSLIKPKRLSASSARATRATATLRIIPWR